MQKHSSHKGALKSREQDDFFAGIKFKNLEDDDELLKSMVEAIPEQVHAKDSLEKKDKNFAVQKAIGRTSKKRTARKSEHSKNPDAALDLHGKTQEEAILLVQNFVIRSHRQHLCRILIITGKGTHSGEEGPVLNQAVRTWLQRNGRPFIKEFFPAPPRHGGTGAFWVELR